MIKSKFNNLAFASGVVPAVWKSTVTVLLYKGRGELMQELQRHQFVSMVGKLYAGITLDRDRRVTKGLVDDEQWGFR